MDLRRLFDGMTRGDVAWPGLILVLAFVELLGMDVVGEPLSLGATTLSCLLLVWRRRAPIAIALAVIATQLSLTFLDVTDEPAVPILSFGLALFALGRYRRPRTSGPWMAVVLLIAVLTLSSSEASWDASDVAFISVLLLTPWGFGLAVGRMDETRVEFATTTDRLESEREAAAAAAIVTERTRIARELHDVIAHSVSVMVVQVGAAQDLLRSDPDRAEHLLESVQANGRRALSETSHVLGLLRTNDDPGLAPQPGLADLELLVGEFRAAGLDVTLDQDRDPPAGERELPVGVDLSVYRIVEESLTNVLKHACGSSARVVVQRTRDVVRVQVINGPGAPHPVARGGGQGLAGMRERAIVFGGELSSGPTADGGFVVDVQLPARSPQ